VTEADPIDDQIRALAAHARRRAEQDAAWEGVSRGDRAAEDVARERLAAGDDPEEVERAKELYRPFDEEEDAALVEAVRRELGRGGGGAEAIDAKQAEAPGSPDEGEPGSSKAAANDGRGYALLGLLAAAVAVVVVWRFWPTPDATSPQSEPTVVAQAALPAYELEADSGLLDQRGDDGPAAKVLRYRSDTPLSWIMRPQVRAEGEVVARMVARRDGQTGVQPMRPELVEVRNGTVRIEGHARDLGLSAGAWTIAIVVGRPGAVPSDPAELWAQASAADVVVERVHIVLE
jgi:hypothetical protein